MHTLVTLLARCRVRSLALHGEPPSDQQMGLEVTNIRRRLSTAAVCAASTVLLARLSQIGQRSGMASRRREWQRREEGELEHSREAGFLVHCTGRELVRRGRFWGRLAPLPASRDRSASEALASKGTDFLKRPGIFL